MLFIVFLGSITRSATCDVAAPPGLLAGGPAHSHRRHFPRRLGPAAVRPWSHGLTKMEILELIYDSKVGVLEIKLIFYWCFMDLSIVAGLILYLGAPPCTEHGINLGELERPHCSVTGIIVRIGVTINDLISGWRAIVIYLEDFWFWLSVNSDTTCNLSVQCCTSQ